MKLNKVEQTADTNLMSEWLWRTHAFLLVGFAVWQLGGGEGVHTHRLCNVRWMPRLAGWCQLGTPAWPPSCSSSQRKCSGWISWGSPRFSLSVSSGLCGCSFGETCACSWLCTGPAAFRAAPTWFMSIQHRRLQDRNQQHVLKLCTSTTGKYVHTADTLVH